MSKNLHSDDSQSGPLSNIRVASPCRANWDNMEGNGPARFCQSCSKNVYNLSDMSRSAAEALIREKEGELCVRFYQRADGTILTNDCPVGLRIVKRPFQWLAAGAAALLASGIAIFGSNTAHSTPAANPPSVPISTRLCAVQPFKTVLAWITSAPVSTMIMGEMVALPMPTAAPAPTATPDPTPEPTETPAPREA